MSDPHEENRSWKAQENAAEQACADLRRQLEALRTKVWTYKPDKCSEEAR